MPTRPSKSLDVVPNPHPDRDYEVAMTAPEFTCVCPMTGQPDFATIRIRYVPDEHLVELKSLKLYLWSYRNEGAFHEDVRSEEHTSELQSQSNLVCRLLLEKKKKQRQNCHVHISDITYKWTRT